MISRAVWLCFIPLLTGAASWEVGARLEAGDGTSALSMLEKVKRGALRYLAGRALELLGKPAEAANAYGQAAASLPALADEIGVRRGEMLLQAGEHAKAARAFEEVLRKTHDEPSRFKERALLGVVRAAARRKACEAAARALYGLAKEHGVRIRPDALLSVARCHERRGELAGAARELESLALFRPRSDAAAKAREALTALRARGVKPPSLSFEDGVRAARSLRWAKRLDEAEARLGEVRPQNGAQARLLRFERAELAHARGEHAQAEKELRAIHDEKPKEPGAEGYLRLSARCAREEGAYARAGKALVAAFRAQRGAPSGRDLWLAGDAFEKAADPEGAAAAYLELAKRLSQHRDAPRAHLAAVEALLANGKFERAFEVAGKFPRGWRRRHIGWRARWLEAWAAFRAGKMKEAKRLLAAIADSRRSPALDKLRARYWTARVDEAASLGPARRAYQVLVREEGESFYADLALSRLRALSAEVPEPPAAAALVDPDEPLPAEAAPKPEAALPTPAATPEAQPAIRPAQVDRAAAAALAKLVKEIGKDLPDLRRAQSLYQLSLLAEAREALAEAQDEVERARRRPVRRRPFSSDPPDEPTRVDERIARLRKLDRAALALTLVPIYRAMGDTARAEENLRRFGRAAEGRRARRAGPFPRTYEDLVRATAQRYSVDPALLFALLRQESAFRTDALSNAGARGLMQIMPGTAKRIAKRLGESLREQWLDDPAFSLRYGAWYMCELLKKYRGQVPLAIAAYNAGPRNVDRWLDLRGALPLDAFLEEIPLTETRRYVRKVLASTRMYTKLLGAKAGVVFANVAIDAKYRDNIDF